MVARRPNAPYEQRMGQFALSRTQATRETVASVTGKIEPDARTPDALIQAQVIAFLTQPSAWPDAPASVDIIQTHGAVVFMAGDSVLKIKRAVHLPYFDFTTLERRRKFAGRELEINAPNAPEIYLGLVAITREVDGTLAIGGAGEPIEWAVHMARFRQDHVLSHIVEQQGLSKDLATTLADAVVKAHRSAPPVIAPSDTMDAVAAQVLSALSSSAAPHIAEARAQFSAAIQAALATSAAIRSTRAREGYIRRCHGDLHLGNLVLWKGAPVLFDAIEFDEHIATIDTLYDLAFLLMDLERYGARQSAHIVLNRYLWKTGDQRDVEGLAALPVFMGLRAGIRAMVTLDRARLMPDERPGLVARALETLQLGAALATPKPARLIVVGGLSGTGKTTLAARIAPNVGSAPGAIHLRTDLERKWLAGVSEFEHLPESAYSQDASNAVFARVLARAKLALSAGHSVILDGVFARPVERQAVEDLADETGARFNGLWLEAAPQIMKARVTQRVHDASDATAAVVEKQLELNTGNPGWPRLDSSIALADLYRNAMSAAGVTATTN